MAGSIVLQISRSLSVFENESKELQETTFAAAKKNDENVDKDVEILRLIEERRKMPKEERQRLKELSKEIKKCIREKKERKDIMTLKESLKNSKVSEISRQSNQQRRESSSRKSRTKKVNASPLEKESPIPLENTTKDSLKTVDKTTLNMKKER